MVITYLWNTNFFEWAKTQEKHSIDTIITDPPYKSFLSPRGEDGIKDVTFDVADFCEQCVELLKPNGIFISFCSMQLMKDYFIHFNGKLRFRCEQIWDKRPSRSWVHYTVPLHHVEYIVYFGEGEIDFRTGDISKKYRRSTFGVSLQVTTKNNKTYSQGQYQQVIELSSKRKIVNKKRESTRNAAHGIVSIQLKDQEPPKGTVNHPTPKPPEFSPYFKKIIQEPGRVLDPCCGMGSLIWAFDDAIGIDIKTWNPVSFEAKEGRGKTLEDFVS